MKSALDAVWTDLGDDPDEALLRRYYQALLAADLLLPHQGQEGDTVSPHIVEFEGGSYALAFDTDTRLVSFFGEGAERVEMAGSALIAMLAEQNLGLALNAGLEEGQFFLGAEGVAWLLEGGSVAAEKAYRFRPLEDVPPEALTQILDAVATLSGRAEHAVLAQGNGGVLVLALIEAEDGIEREFAPVLSVIDAGAPLEIVLMSHADFAASVLGKVGLGLDIPKPPEPTMPLAPGMDPDTPPKLF